MEVEGVLQAGQKEGKISKHSHNPQGKATGLRCKFPMPRCTLHLWRKLDLLGIRYLYLVSVRTALVWIRESNV